MKRFGFTLVLLSGFVFAQACSNIDNTPTAETTVSAVAKTIEPTPKVLLEENNKAIASPVITDEVTATPSTSKKAVTPKQDGLEVESTSTPLAQVKEVQNNEQPAVVNSSVKVEAEIQPIPSTEELVETETSELESASGAPSHAVFSGLLKENVSRGKVNYEGLKKNQATLKSYIEMLGANAPGDDWSRNEKLAYWINAYNAVTINLILDNYPVKSITDLSNGKPWDKKIVTLGGKSYSLNQIENDIIRPRFNEPRIHFAVNCAAISCPPIRNEAFVASKLDEQLDEQTRSFLKNEAFNALNGKTFRASKIFDWYGEDFGDLNAFISKYTNLPADATIEFVDYNWALNKQ